MHILLVAFLALIPPLVHSQTAALPTCAISCLLPAISAAGCSSSDINCWCHTQQSAFSASFTQCAIASCPASDLTIAANTIQNACLESGSYASATAAVATAGVGTSIAVFGLSSVPHIASATTSVAGGAIAVTTHAFATTEAAASTAGGHADSSSVTQNVPTIVPSKTASTAYIPPPSPTSTAIDTSGGAASSPDSTGSPGSTSSPGSTGSPDTSGGGLSTGAKAGIGIAVALLAILVILGIWLYLRRRRRSQSPPNDPEIPPARGQEMPTSANVIEIDSKNAGTVAVAEKKFYEENPAVELSTSVADEKTRLRDAGEMEKAPLPEMHGSTGNGAVTRDGPLPEMHGNTGNGAMTRDALVMAELHAQQGVHVHEMPAMATATNVGSDWEHFGASELASDTTVTHPDTTAELPVSVPVPAAELAPAQLSAEAAAVASSSTVVPAADDVDSARGDKEGGDKKLEILKQRIERVREDKERLEKIQQLKDLEAELQGEIMAEQRRQTGGG